MKILRIFLLLVFFMFLTVGSVMAITVDGNFTDWGFANITGFQDVDAIANDITGEIDHGFTNGVYWSEEDYVEAGTYGQVYPGYGGQSFDHEGLYLTEDANTYYIGLMSGMAPGANYSHWSSTPQYIGDIAIDTGNGFDQAIWTNNIRAGSPSQGIYLVDVYAWEDTTSYHPVYNPSPYEMINGSLIAGVDFGYAQHGDSYFYEFGIDKQYIDSLNGLTAFVTMSCGNDWLQTENHPTTVPEPATMILFGTGLMIFVGLKRKFKN